MDEKTIDKNTKDNRVKIPLSTPGKTLSYKTKKEFDNYFFTVLYPLWKNGIKHNLPKKRKRPSSSSEYLNKLNTIEKKMKMERKWRSPKRNIKAERSSEWKKITGETYK